MLSICPPSKKMKLSSNKKSKKRNMSTYRRVLPDEIISDVLSRLPAKVLYPWRRVCKNWFHMFKSNQSFIDLQIRRSRPTLIFDIPKIHAFEVDIILDEPVTITTTTTTSTTTTTMTATTTGTTTTEVTTTATTTADPIPTFSFREFFYDPPCWKTKVFTYIEGSCNGLLCLYRCDVIFDKFGTFYIGNPATRQWMRLPRCNLERPFAQRFGYDPLNKKYKLVHFADDNENMYDLRCEILTIGSQTWREIECPLEPTSYCDPPIILDNFLHWNPMKYAVVSFDIGSEKFRKISIPRASDSEIPYLFKMDHSLALGISDTEINTPYKIWILEDYTKGIWIKKYNITLDMYALPKSFVQDYYPAASWNNGEIVFFMEVDGLHMFCYEPKYQRFRKISTDWDNWACFVSVLEYTSTLVSPSAVIA